MTHVTDLGAPPRYHGFTVGAAKNVNVFQSFERDQKTISHKLSEFYDAIQKLRYEGKVQQGKNARALRNLLYFFQTDLLRHLREEEKVLFPFLRTHIPKLEPIIRVLLSEHDGCRATLKDLRRSYTKLTKGQGKETGALHELYEQGIYFSCLVRSHLWVESQNLYLVADRELHLAEKKRLIVCAGSRS